jgi:hypothetical protein
VWWLLSTSRVGYFPIRPKALPFTRRVGIVVEPPEEVTKQPESPQVVGVAPLPGSVDPVTSEKPLPPHMRVAAVIVEQSAETRPAS